jgi:AcrR family transcriptional regulator
MPRPRADRVARRAEFATVAASLFADRGVANTSVSDIVKAAGVAQGTFYLYFDTKDEVILAVVEQLADRMVAGIEQAVAATGTTAPEKLLGLRDVLVAFDREPTSVELADLMHRPENRELHERLAASFTPRLIPLVEAIVAQGVSDGVFDVRDTSAAAWFVLGGLRSVELAGTPVEHMPAAIAAVTDLALRALGYQERTA